MRIYITMLLLIFAFGCRTKKTIAIQHTKTDTVSTIFTKDIDRLRIDSSFRAAAIDSYDVEEITEYSIDTVTKASYPVKKTVKSKGTKTQVTASDKHTDAVSDFTTYIEGTKTTDTYSKEKDVKRDSSVTGLVIAVVVIAVYLVIKMIRNGK